ncbi:unnamed protein product [Musa hybrid cultivar]
MASISQLITTSIPTTFPLSSSCPFSPPRTTVSISGFKHHHHVSPISCSTRDHNQPLVDPTVDRRHVLVGLGSLYGASAALTSLREASAAPIAAPDLSACGPADLPPDATPTNCCPPSAGDATEFVIPDPSSPLRVRPAAHSVDKDYIAKFAKGVALMKALPADDPRNFTQHANVHCAYCDGAYSQVGFPDLELQVHNSWLFLPWHRCFLYFFERILGKLIGDDSFAIPFWNWDAPDGMRLPAMYVDPTSPLYDPLRDAQHQPPTLVDLDFGGIDPSFSDKQQIDHNLKVMYRQIVSNAPTPRLFFGNPYRAGDNPNPGGGSLENVPHGPVHVWTGDRSQSELEDMGNLYSAARDPVFFAHHSNIDRIWNVWKGLGGRRKDLADPDWLDASFVFYDENANLVKIRVRDCIDSDKLRYEYQDVGNPWLNTRPTVTSGVRPRVAGVAHANVVEPKFPMKLDSVMTAKVKRPKAARTKEEKEEKEEVLVVEGIELDRDVHVKFDVFVNVTDHGKVGPGGRELAGSFVNVPHRHKHDKMSKRLKTRLQLGLTELLEDLKAEGDGSIMVTLVPRQGKGKVKVGSLKIELVD